MSRIIISTFSVVIMLRAFDKFGAHMKFGLDPVSGYL